MPRRVFVHACCLLTIAGCVAASRLSLVPSAGPLSASGVATIAMAPGSGPLAEAIGVEFSNAGMTVMDANATTEIVRQAGLKEFEVSSGKGLEALRDKSIDAVLVATSVDGSDGRLESASVRVTATASGETVAGATWQNGWGGRAGSIADRKLRKNLTGAAQEIAVGLLKQLRPMGKHPAR